MSRRTLSHREQRELAGIGARLADDDPPLAASLTAQRSRPSTTTLALVALVAGLASLIGLAAGSPFAFAAFVVSLAATDRALRRASLAAVAARVARWLDGTALDRRDEG